VSQDKWTKLARGMDCQIRLPGCCNFNPETTVLAHYRLSGTCGMGIKPHSLLGAWACSACHDICDSRSHLAMARREYIRLAHAEGVLRTLNELIKRGKL
jgi:Protein of unknown function (DUF1364)